MKHRVPLLIGVVAVGGVAAYFMLGRDSKTEMKPSEQQVTQVHTPPSASPGVTPQLRNVAPVASTNTAPVEHAQVDGLPEVLEPGYLAIERAAKTCQTGRPAPTPIRPNGPDETIETIKLSYRQVAANGVGHIEAVTVIDGKLTDQALQSCIVRVAGEVTWSASAPDGLIGTLEQNINVGDLMRPEYGLPPPSKRSPKPTAPPPPELAGPLGQQAPGADDVN
jgi:hypothetical protein